MSYCLDQGSGKENEEEGRNRKKNILSVKFEGFGIEVDMGGEISKRKQLGRF